MLQRYGQSDTLFHPHYKRSRCYKSLTPQRRVTEKGCSTSYLSMVIEYDRMFWWLFVSHEREILSRVGWMKQRNFVEIVGGYMGGMKREVAVCGCVVFWRAQARAHMDVRARAPKLW